jgi:Fe2+ transport system protein FeoA
MPQNRQSAHEPTLDNLPVGTHATIKSIEFSPLMGRLVDLGFAPGAEVTVLRTVPLGDLRVYRVDGCDVSLRVSTAQTVKVILRDGTIQ